MASKSRPQKIATATFALVLAACGTGVEVDATRATAQIDQETQALGICPSSDYSGCYWMENYSGNYCWLPREDVTSVEQCFALDSCSGGQGLSLGGCYQWSDCADCAPYEWPFWE
jgi:hypothetical protein